MSTSYASPLVRMSPWSEGRYRSLSGWFFDRIRLQRCLRLCRSLPSSEVLEIGCHDMLFYQLLGRRFRKYVGLDCKPYLPRLQGGQEHLPGNVSVRQGMAESLPFDSSSFDTILSFETIAYLANEDRAIAEIARVLKPQGKLVVSVPIEFGLLLPLKVLGRSLAHGKWTYRFGELLWASLLCQPASIERQKTKGYDFRHTIARLRHLGLKVESVRRLPFAWLPSWLNLGVILVCTKLDQSSEPATSRELRFHSEHS